MGRKRIYTDEERKQRHKKCVNKYQQEHKDEIAEYHADYYAKWYQENKEKKLERQAEYHKTPMGRALYLVGGYQREDKKANRGECTLTSKWVVENIFSKPCHYCGETDWLKIGCDRIDNSLPHTPENVVPCCMDCNRKRGRKSYEEFLNSN